MDAEQDGFFVTGGTLPTDAPSYVVRQADQDLLECLRHGEYCYVLDTRQMGKSSLMVRAAERLREEGVHIAVIDLTAIGQNLTINQWYLGMMINLGQQLGCEDDLLTAWRQNREMGPLQRFIGCVSIALEWLKTQTSQSPRLVLFVDEIDAVRGLPFSADEFFVGIRECYNRRSHDPLYRNLAVCLLGVASPTDLIRETLISPFNIGRRIVLTDFQQEEADVLQARLSDSSSQGQRLLKRIFHWTGGHPYMTQRLCLALASQPAARTPASVDRLCKDLFLSSNALETDDNLAFARNRLLNSVEDLAGLLDLYARILRGKRTPDDPADPYCAILHLSGVVRSVKGYLRVRNRIYARVFDARWIQTHMPYAELRRQQRAYRHGLLRATGFAGVILTVLSVLAATAFRQANLAVKAQRELALHLSQNFVANGIRLAEEGDALTALSLLAEALRLDRHDPARMEMDRYRIAAVLQQIPPLAQIWFVKAPLRAAQFSPDGHRVLIACQDGSAAIWDVSSGSAVTPEMRHGSILNAARFSPDGRCVVTCGEDGYARLWDAVTGRMLRALKHGNPVVSAAWSPDGRRIATASKGRATVWETDTGRSLLNEEMPGAQITGYVFSADGQRVVTLSSNFLTYIFDLAKHTGWPLLGIGAGQRVGCYDGAHAEFSRSGSRLLIAGALVGGSQQNGAFLFHSGPARQAIGILHHPGLGTDARFSPDESRVVSADSNGIARVWDITAGIRLMAELKHPAGLRSASFSPDGRAVVTNCDDGIVRVWDARTGALQHPLIRHAGPIETAEFAPTGQRMLTAGRDGTVRLWDLGAKPFRGRVVETFDSVGSAYFMSAPRLVLQYRKARQEYVALWDTLTGVKVLAVAAKAFQPLTRRTEMIAVTESAGISVRDVLTGKPLLPTRMPVGERICLSAQGRFRCRYAQGYAHLLDAVSNRAIGVPMLAYPLSNPFSLDESRFVAITNEGVLRVFDTATGSALGWSAQMERGAGRSDPGNAEFSPDGHYLYTWSRQTNSFQLWDARSGLMICREHHEKGILQILPSPDNWHVCAIWGNQFTLFDLTSGLAVPAVAPRDERDGLMIAFSPSGKRFLVYSTTASVWDTATGRRLTPYLDHNSLIENVAFSPDERSVVTISKDSALRMWDAATGSLTAPPISYPGKAQSVMFSPDGRRVLVTGSDDMVRIWDAHTGEPAAPAFPLMATWPGARFAPDGHHIIGVGDREIRICDIVPDERPVENLLSLATLLSGEHRDSNVGTDYMKPEALLLCWQRLQGDRIAGHAPFVGTRPSY